MSPIGFIGLGNMGSHMARNLIAKGVKLAVHDTNQVIVNEFARNGAEICSSPAELASKCKEIVTMLPNTSDVISTFSEKSGIIE
jgi:3-hydroxyisobutyrate dehydrogenase